MAAQQLQVCLHRDSLYTSWGFRLEGGAEYHRSFSVQRVQACSAAEGQLKPGDLLIAIEGFDCQGMTHHTATEMIANAGSTLQLIVKRHGPQMSYQPYQRTRMHSQPQPQQHSYQPTVLHRTTSQDEKTPIPRNSGLAKMMIASMTEDTEPRQKSGLSGIDLLLRHANPGRDITDYLPAQPRRSSVSGRATPMMMNQSAPHYATLRPRTQSHTHRDSEMRSQLWDSVLRASTPGAGTATGSDSGRSTPVSTAFEFGKHEKPTAVGVWTPPVHTPSARLMHQQYNSPLALYTPHNVADQIHKQTGTKLSWQKKPPVRFLEDITDSPTYKFLRTMEQGSEQQPVIARTRAEQPVTAQSYTFRRLNRQLSQEPSDPPHNPVMTSSHYSQF